MAYHVLGPIPSLHDLKITSQESTLVPPSQETERRSIFLTNFDQLLNYNVPIVHFFKADPDFAPEAVAERLRSALGRVLVEYDFMAGRLKANRDEGRLEIECDGSGAGFVVASSEFSLDGLGDLVCPNVGFRQLVVQAIDNLGPGQDQPLCVFQVTSFECGGFAIGACTNHLLFDGSSTLSFVENLASQAFGNGRPLATVPCHNRRLLAARAPPRVDLEHPEFFKLDHLPESGVPNFDCGREENLDYRVFKLTSVAIDYLKDKARTARPASRITRYSVVAALMWRCRAMSAADDDGRGDVSTFLNVVDLRHRMDPPLPPSYCGNAVLVTYSAAKRADIRLEESWAGLVEMVANGPARVNEEYVRSVIDWLEINRGIPCGEYIVSSWLRLRYDQVVYPWGKPVHSGPVVSQLKDMCWVFADGGGGGGVNAMVSLPPEQMERFESSFRRFFRSL